MPLYLELLTVFSLTLVNGALAMSELAVVSSRRSRLESMAKAGKHGAARALLLVDDPSRFLSTVQIGITMVGIFAGAFSGATLGVRLGDMLSAMPGIGPYGGPAGIAITVVCITYLSLILGELVPKRIALNNPEAVACFAAGPMWTLSIIAAPIVWVLGVSQNTVLRLLRIKGNRESGVTEEEIKMLIAEAADSGIFEEREKELVYGVLRLADRPVYAIMTPRAQVRHIDINASAGEILEAVNGNRFSRLLVTDGSIEKPVGTAHTKDLLRANLNNEPLTLKKLMAPLLFVQDHTTVLKLLELFKTKKTHIAVVLDGHGKTEGLVTPTDVLESIAGNMPEHGQHSTPRMQQRRDGSWIVDGALNFDAFQARIGAQLDTERSFDTVASFILKNLGHLPETGECAAIGNLDFEILGMDGAKVGKVLVTIRQEPGEPPA